jgi:hypothetical protein
VGVAPLYELKSPLSPGVLVSATVLADSMLYVLVSDSADAAKIDLRDRSTGARLTLELPAQHAAIAVVGKKEGSVIARYGF